MQEGFSKGKQVEINPDELRTFIAELPDSELLRMTGVDSSEYRPEALEHARQELARRNVPVPEAGAPAQLSDAFDQGSTSVQSARKDPFSGSSTLTKLLLSASIGYAAIARMGRFSDAPVRLNPAWGIATISALLWSVSWDVRARSREPKWPIRLVLLALLSTVATLYTCVNGSLW